MLLCLVAVVRRIIEAKRPVEYDRFASTVHPPKDNSFWAAARRTLIIYDWLGHGRNRAKMCQLHPAQQQQIAQCPHCKGHDDQAHCMLECPHQPFTAPRQHAKKRQNNIASTLRIKYAHDEALQRFIEQLSHASWTPSPNISRIWFGTWTPTTLRQMLGQPTDRRTYLLLVAASLASADFLLRFFLFLLRSSILLLLCCGAAQVSLKNFEGFENPQN